MSIITHLTPTFAVTSAMTREDFAEAAQLGFRCVVSNLPDGEGDAAMTAREEAVAAWRSGLSFAHVPAPKHEILCDEVVARMADVLRGASGPVLAHCKTGTRSAILWAAASARARPVDCVLEATRQAGFDLSFLREDLERQASRKHWLGEGSDVLDCSSWSKAPRLLTNPLSRGDLALLSAAAHAL